MKATQFQSMISASAAGSIAMSSPKFDAAAYHDEGYQAHVNCDGKESNRYKLDSAEWHAWNGGYDQSVADFEEE